MKTVDFGKWANRHESLVDLRCGEKVTAKPKKEEPGMVVQLHALLEKELSLYRGTSTTSRLGVIRKYDELIAHARKKRPTKSALGDIEPA